MKQRPVHNWSIVAIAIVGLACTVGAVHQSESANALRRQRAFERITQGRAEAFALRLAFAESLAESTAGLFDASVSVSAEEFEAYCRRWVGPGKRVDRLGWAVRVSPDHRAAFEAEQRDHRPTFRIHGFGDRGFAREEAPSYPLVYLEPQAGGTFGYDVASLAPVEAAIDEAVDGGTSAVSGPVRHPGSSRAYSYVVAPVYSKGIDLDDRADRTAHLTGIIVVRIDLEQELNALLDSSSTPLGGSLTALHPDTEPDIVASRILDDGELSVRRRLKIGGRAWELGLVGNVESAADASSALIAGVGVLLTALVIAWIASLRDRNGQVTRLVEERTARLAESNLKLREENEARRRAEGELSAAVEAAERASQSKGQFLANMSHEIRTPMNGVLGLTELLLGTDLDPDQRDLVDTIRHSGDALLQILNDILDFSKIEADKLEIERIEFDLDGVINDVLELLAEKAAERALSLAFVPSAAAPRRVIGDPARIRQVLLNLVGNAIKFTADGSVVVRCAAVGEGMIEIAVTDSGIGIDEAVLPTLFDAFTQADESTTRRFGGTGLGLAICRRLVAAMGGDIDVESTPDVGSTFRFTVAAEVVDEGAAVERAGRPVVVVTASDTMGESLAALCRRVGRPADLVSSAHDLDRYAESSTAQGFVALVDTTVEDIGSAVDRLDRRVRVVAVSRATGREQETRHDTRLRTPVRTSALERALTAPDGATEEAADDAVATNFDGLRILLAEDNRVNQKVASRMLTKLGCEVEIAQDGVEAVAASAKATYDLVLMDCSMPNLDGLEATRQIREREQAEGAATRLPIIALTASALIEDRDRCFDAGMDDYAAKPISSERIEEVIRAATARKSDVGS